jgi:hypothetical protein
LVLDRDAGADGYVTYQTLPFGITVTKVVLARPASLTHHSDGNQRLVEVPFEHVAETSPPQLRVYLPSATHHSRVVPNGHYMIFLLSNQGVPSEAGWVLVQP